jgi:hypothetical protein
MAQQHVSDPAAYEQAVGGSVPALQSLHLGAEQMQDLMPAGKPAAKKSSKAKVDVRPAVFLPPELDNDEPFVPPLAALKRCCTQHTMLLVSSSRSASSI